MHTTKPSQASALEETNGPSRETRNSCRLAIVQRLWTFALGAGVAAGLASWAFGEQILGRYQAPVRTMMFQGMPRTGVLFVDVVNAETKNATLAFAILGTCLGFAMGMAGGMARGSFATALLAGTIGAVTGCLAGASATQATLPAYFRVVARLQEEIAHDLALPLLTHTAIWMAAGAAGGLAFGIGIGGGRRLVRSVLGGLAGAGIGSVLYELVGALVFPLADTYRLFSATWETRLLARGLVTIGASLGIVYALTGKWGETTESLLAIAGTPGG